MNREYMITHSQLKNYSLEAIYFCICIFKRQIDLIIIGHCEEYVV